MSNKIRKISIGTELNSLMSFSLGSKHPFYIDGEKCLREIHNIMEAEEHYMIYLINTNGEIQLWKKLPKNSSTSVEYVID